ncbi:zinc finger BED domain-containing protein 5-like [Portunus trituberculatus]|uniref:zinc finger BED domain-containing protein 5-like n=1 Tax=Portunus trituberculatus TaxID=210409 RepID=UPI001E1CCA88|nr:zinc finger BED domain-containing protein 5-like [Portunus trituberculatus]
MSQKRRWYHDSYLDYGFTYLVKDGAHIPQCVVCLKTFSNSITKPFQLKQHLANAHPQLKDKNRSFFEVKLSSLKRMKMDASGTYQQTNISIVKASYVIALQVAKAKKPHTIGESLLKPCIVDSVV